jgi:hypothetical protein
MICCSAGELPQDVFGKDATAEFDPLVHQSRNTFSPSWLMAVMFLDLGWEVANHEYQFSS